MFFRFDILSGGIDLRFNDFFNKLRYYLKDSYGFDRLSKYIFIAGALCFAIKYLSIIGLGLMGYSIWRSLSKNRYKRYEELQKFNDVLSAVKYKFNNRKEFIDNIAHYKIFICPNCSQKLRVPRKKGKITITCKKCGTQFKGKS